MAKCPRSKTHVIAVRVQFNKPISKAAAQRAVGGEIKGQTSHATLEGNSDGWTILKFKGVQVRRSKRHKMPAFNPRLERRAARAAERMGHTIPGNYLG